MKIYSFLGAFGLCCSVFWATSTFLVGLESGKPSSADVRTADLRVEEMDARIAEIADRVGMAASLEAPLPEEYDFVTEKLEEGWIVEATLEEVETALESAASTPSPDDDIAAMRLAHRGSYRFFLDEVRPSSETGNE